MSSVSVSLYAAILLLVISPDEAVPGGGAPGRPALAAHLGAAGGGGLRHTALGQSTVDMWAITLFSDQKQQLTVSIICGIVFLNNFGTRMQIQPI